MVIVQTFWMGQLSVLEKTCLQSFVVNGHDVHLYSYEDIAVPAGVKVYDANTILSKDKVFIFQNSLAAFSDMFRYKLLLDKGNYWIDSDVICLKQLNFNEDYVFASEYLDINHNTETITSCIIKAPKNDKMIQNNYEYCEQINKNIRAWGQIGPALLNKSVSEYNLQKFVKPAKIFCPTHHMTCTDFVNPERSIQTADSYCVHLWNEMWKRNNLDKNRKYHDQCFYEQIKRQYYARLNEPA